MKTKEILSVEILPLKETRKHMFEENLIFKEDGAGLDGIQLALLTKEIAKNNEKGLKEVNVVHPSLGIKCRIENIVMVTNDWKETLAQVKGDDFVYLDPPYIGRHTDYYNKWDDYNATELAETVKKLPCGFAYSMWKSNQYRENEHINQHFNE